MSVKFKTEGQEAAGKDDITQSEHGKIGLGSGGQFKDISGEQQLDGDIKAFGDSHHDVSSKDPKDIVDEEAAKQDHSRGKAVQMNHGDGSDTKALSEDIAGDPVLAPNIIGTKSS